MKIRTDFVTNSSSSSFIVIAKNKEALKTSITIPIDFNDLTSCTMKTKKAVLEYSRLNYLDAETTELMLAEIEKGNSLFDVQVCSDDHEPVARYIYEKTEGDYEDVQRLLPGLVILDRRFE
jgi:hypothetical protein